MVQGQHCCRWCQPASQPFQKLLTPERSVPAVDATRIAKVAALGASILPIHRQGASFCLVKCKCAAKLSLLTAVSWCLTIYMFVPQQLVFVFSF